VGHLEDAAHFAVWYRRLVPVRYPLAFYDESYSKDVTIEAGTSEEQISAPFLAT
jgi:hypothetical protein